MARLFQCPASAALAHVVEESSSAAARGTQLHDYVQAKTIGRPLRLKLSPEIEEETRKIKLQQLRGFLGEGPWRDEVAFAFDVVTETGREVGQHLGRNYSLAPNEIGGAADWFLHDGREGHVVDLKTGQRVESAEENLQLLTLAVMAMAAHDLDTVRVSLVYLNQDGSFSPFQSAVVDIFAREVFVSDLRRKLDQAAAAVEQLQAGSIPDVRRGPACDYCPAVRYCPAYKSFALTLLSEGNELANRFTLSAEIQPSELARVYQFKKDAQRLLDLLDEEIRKHLPEGGLPLANGKLLEQVAHRREEIVGEVAYQAIEKEFGQVVAEQCSRRLVSKQAIESLGRDRGRRVLELIRNTPGAVANKVVLYLKEVNAK